MCECAIKCLILTSHPAANSHIVSLVIWIYFVSNYEQSILSNVDWKTGCEPCVKYITQSCHPDEQAFSLSPLNEVA